MQHSFLLWKEETVAGLLPRWCHSRLRKTGCPSRPCPRPRGRGLMMYVVLSRMGDVVVS
jgi:hypothetical protein